VLYSANNAKLRINGNEILASDANITLGTSLSPRYLITQRNSNDYFASNGIGGQLSFNYFITGRDYFKTFITGQGEIPQSSSQLISGNFGGLNFDSGYLTSYSVNFGPNAAATASATIAFYDQLNGEFSSTESAAPTSTQMLNFKKGVVSGQFASGEVDNFIEGTYNYSMEVNPVYLMNETKPSSVSFGVKNVSMNFEIDNPTGYLPVSGTNALISVDLKNSDNDIAENFSCSGEIQNRNISSAAGSYIKQTINVVQASTQATTVFVGSITDNAGNSSVVGIGTTGPEGNLGNL
tara:strand:+ start:4258 stop:5139 length:882 start_codon:yes stop_codon:yes gene_type:complete